MREFRQVKNVLCEQINCFRIVNRREIQYQSLEIWLNIQFMGLSNNVSSVIKRILVSVNGNNHVFDPVPV